VRNCSSKVVPSCWSLNCYFKILSDLSILCRELQPNSATFRNIWEKFLLKVPSILSSYLFISQTNLSITSQKHFKFLILLYQIHIPSLLVYTMSTLNYFNMIFYGGLPCCCLWRVWGNSMLKLLRFTQNIITKATLSMDLKLWEWVICKHVKFYVKRCLMIVDLKLVWTIALNKSIKSTTLRTLKNLEEVTINYIYQC